MPGLYKGKKSYCNLVHNHKCSCHISTLYIYFRQTCYSLLLNAKLNNWPTHTVYYLLWPNNISHRKNDHLVDADHSIRFLLAPLVLVLRQNQISNRHPYLRFLNPPALSPHIVYLFFLLTSRIQLLSVLFLSVFSSSVYPLNVTIIFHSCLIFIHSCQLSSLLYCQMLYSFYQTERRCNND